MTIISAIQSRCILYHCIPESEDQCIHEMNILFKKN